MHVVGNKTKNRIKKSSEVTGLAVFIVM